jgi:hypothetical protein
MPVVLGSDRGIIGHADASSGFCRYVALKTSMDAFIADSPIILAARNNILAGADGWCSTRGWGTHAPGETAVRHATVDTSWGISVIAHVVTRLASCPGTQSGGAFHSQASCAPVAERPKIIECSLFADRAVKAIPACPVLEIKA